MHTIDWALLAVPLVLVLVSGFYTSRYIKGVAHFLSAGRLADRYLLAVSQGEMQAGAITFAAAFEVMSRSGVALTWWGMIGTPFWLIIGISGFVLYRFRETRAMTLAQFFEVRYSKSFRIFSGCFSFLAGLMNFGIIPVIGARFFVWFLGMPLTAGFFGHSIPTEVALMAVFLIVSVTITMLGGMVTMMVTDCVEGIISQIFYLLLIFGLLAMFDWSEVSDVLTKETVVVRQTIEQTVNVAGTEKRVIEKEFNPPGKVVNKSQFELDAGQARELNQPMPYQPVKSLYTSEDGKVLKVEKALVPRAKGQSLLNPFDSTGVKDFNIWYILMGLFLGVYGTMGWQFSGGFRGASINAHEGRMGGVLGAWRSYGKGAAVGVLVLCTLAWLQHSDFTAQAAAANEQISSIANPTIQKQMYIPIGLAHVLPTGLKGALCVILLMGLFSGDSTHLHSWASIFVQDLLVPLRKKPFTAKQHILILRLAVLGVALFAFFFGWLFQPGDYIVMWWAITTSLFVAGAGAAIIGGLYWKKATNTGAWVGMITGSSLSLAAIVWRQLSPDARRAALEWTCRWLPSPSSTWLQRVVDPDNAPNFMQMSFVIALLTVVLFITVSLLTCRENFNMDRMLHRGRYAKPEPEVPGEKKKAARPPGIWGRMIGLDDNFSSGDKWIAVGLFALNMVWFVIFAIGTLWNLVKPWPIAWWSAYYHFCVFVYPVFFAVITAIWFTWGGIRGMKRLFTLLKAQKVNELDDGTVVGHQNLDDVEK
jgi:Na+/proline symporter